MCLDSHKASYSKRTAVIAYGSVKSGPSPFRSGDVTEETARPVWSAHVRPRLQWTCRTSTVQLKKLCWKHPSFLPYACGYKFRFVAAVSGLSRPCDFSCEVCWENGERRVEEKQMVKWEVENGEPHLLSVPKGYLSIPRGDGVAVKSLLRKCVAKRESYRSY